MKRLKLTPGQRALVIVAHPDDETIWMGGTILMNPGVRWTIFCLSRSSDKDRAPKFRRACRRYGAKAIMTDLDDEGRLTLEKSITAIKRLLTLKLKGKPFDYLFTHGENGEYGHILHRGVHRAVIEWLPKQKAGVGEAMAFNYRKTSPGKRPSLVYQKNSDYYLPLPAAVFREKRRIQADIHGYARDGIDVGFCTNPEAFKIV